MHIENIKTKDQLEQFASELFEKVKRGEIGPIVFNSYMHKMARHLLTIEQKNKFLHPEGVKIVQGAAFNYPETEKFHYN